jgi:adenylate kinase
MCKDLMVVFLGAPGAGKGTQSDVIADKMSMAHLSSGDLFRKAVARGDELGKIVESYMKSGALVPDEITTKTVLTHMNNEGIRRAILDGFPRTISQAESLDKALEADGRKLDAVILIDVPDEELIRRLASRWVCRECQTPYNYPDGPQGARCKCGGELFQRADDKRETVANRLDVYQKNTAPLIEYYEKQGKLIRVSGVGDITEISHRITDALVEL